MTKEEALEKIEELRMFIRHEDKRESLEKMINSIDHDCGAKVVIDGKYAKVALPNANTDWSLASFKYAIDFCNKYPLAQIRHDKFFDYEFIYISLEHYL